MSECDNGCNENYMDDPNHHHHDFSHSHPSDDDSHDHTNVLDTGKVLYREMTVDEMTERLTNGQGVWCHPIVQVYPEPEEADNG